MASFLGIDIRKNQVRAVLIRTSYRAVAFEAFSEVDCAEFENLSQAVRACTLHLAERCDGVAVAVDGDLSFIHRITLPAAAAKQLSEVLPFELEAQVPVDFEELVYDYASLPRASSADSVSVLTASARIESVTQRIALVRDAIGHEPERVGCGAIPLANLVEVSPDLSSPGPIAVADLGQERTEVVVLQDGQAVFARTLSIGVSGLPESAPRLAAVLRQTFAAAGARSGAPVHTLFLAGSGAGVSGAEAYLTSELGVRTQTLPPLGFDGITSEQERAAIRCAKALGLALGLRGRPRDLDLRQGPLNFQRGFGFLKEKAPLLSGLAAAVLISFFFSTWAELRSLGYENEALAETLAALSEQALGEKLSDPDEVFRALEQGATAEVDPMPMRDAFDVMVELSNAIPTTITHDVDELDMQREHVALRGIVGTTTEAQQIADSLSANDCFNDVKIAKVTQVVNSSRQKYRMEFDVECPEEAAQKGSKKAKGD